MRTVAVGICAKCDASRRTHLCDFPSIYLILFFMRSRRSDASVSACALSGGPTYLMTPGGVTFAGTKPMKKVAKMLSRHRPLLRNWFRAKKQFSSGIVEGFNTKAKLTTRKSYGFRTYKAAEIALYHAPGALPVPITTHEFF